MLYRTWCSRWTGIRDNLPLVLWLMAAAIFFVGLVSGCGPGGSASARAKEAGNALLGEFNPWTLMGWIGGCCLIASAFLAINMKLMQALMAIGVGLAFLFLSAFLKQYGTVVILAGLGAAVWFAATNWGMLREQLRAWLASRKLELEGKVAEATALKRQAFPVLDWKMKRESKRRKRAASKSGSIKPVAKETP